MTTDQCPSTISDGPKHKPAKGELIAQKRSLSGTVNGMTAFRSHEELADSPEFRDFVEREFPSGASELLSTSRRGFMQVMGASLALAGIATVPGCRRPDHKILPYSREVPEDIIPGKPLYYATSMPLPGGGSEGLLIETHEGRPTKVEGNPLHSINMGKSSVFAQASILTMYDPDRLKFPFYAPSEKQATWDDFRAWSEDHFATFEKSGGEGLAVVVDKKTSPTRDAVATKLKARFPKMTWLAWDAVESRGTIDGTALALGTPCRQILKLDKARTILSFDHDFLANDAGQLPNARNFASTRIPTKAAEGSYAMSRLYVVESGFSLTGGQADHRLRLAPSRVVAFAVALAQFILPKLGKAGAQGLVDALNSIKVADTESIDRAFLEECAKDLMAGSNAADRAQSVVLAGRNMPPEVHAIAVALNDAFGSLGSVVRYLPMSAEDASDSMAGIRALSAKMAAGKIKTLVCVEANPVFNAPADLKFSDLYKKVPTTICMSVEASETAAASTWSLNGCHYLESWGDTTAHDGTIAPIQPMIAPLFGPQITKEEKAASEADRSCPALSELELLSLIAGNEHPDGYEILRESWRDAWKKITPGETEDSANTRWRRSLHNGFMEGQPGPAYVSAVNYANVAAAAAKFQTPKGPANGTLDVVFTVGLVHDGRFANVAWLQELPQIGTMVCWDNPALMSPKTAVKLGLWDENPKRNRYTEDKWPKADMAEITVNGRTMKIAVWILPGMADDTVLLTFGYGREVSGLVGDGVGFNTYALRGTDTGTFATGATAKKIGDDYWIASTQNHWSMEGRTSIIRALDLPAFSKHAGDAPEVRKDELYGTETKINLAERLGELSHAPPNQSIYSHPYNNSTKDAAAGSAFSKGPQWGMTIDLSTCTGCGVCTIACQAENNIPSVGKKETAKGREMTWIRLDRYFAGYGEGDSIEMLNNPSEMMHQPVACVHCEAAPCETVCPVNATIHTKDGLNSMAYNRCIGTRYCANNCPYKVRRFNYFDYGVTKFNGGFLGKETVDKVATVLPNDNTGLTGSTRHGTLNPNLIPPRLREKLDQLSRMQKNPDVSVRSRGVMEKCTYCVQRINAARIECNLRENLDPKLRNQIPDGFFQTACQQACPSNSITFGDILDTANRYEQADLDEQGKQRVRMGSRVVHTRNDARSYALLGFLNTRPRTSHMLKVRNPNALLLGRMGKASQERIESWEHPFHHSEPGGKGHSEEGHEGSDHTPAKQPEKHAFFDSGKRADDGGYALSLRVLGTGAHA